MCTTCGDINCDQCPAKDFTQTEANITRVFNVTTPGEQGPPGTPGEPVSPVFSDDIFSI